MSIMEVLKKDIGGKKKPAEAGLTPVQPAAAATEAAPAKVKKSKTSSAPPMFAQSPRANLLPPEIGINNRARSARRAMRLAVVLVLIFTIAGVGGAWLYSFVSAQSLAAEQLETQRLVADQAKHAETQKILDGIDYGEAAEAVGGETDIDWSAFVSDLTSTLPDGVAISSLSIESADIQTPYSQSDTPLEGQRIATVNVTVKSSSLPSVPEWFDRLAGLKGFADAAPGSVSFADGVYETSVTMHLTTKAFSDKYAKGDDK